MYTMGIVNVPYVILTIRRRPHLVPSVFNRIQMHRPKILSVATTAVRRAAVEVDTVSLVATERKRGERDVVRSVRSPYAAEQ